MANVLVIRLARELLESAGFTVVSPDQHIVCSSYGECDFEVKVQHDLELDTAGQGIEERLNRRTMEDQRAQVRQVDDICIERATEYMWSSLQNPKVGSVTSVD